MMGKRFATALLVLFLVGGAEAVSLKMGADEDYTREHVDMDVSSVRLCGTFPFVWPCVDINYWVPKWMVKARLLSVQSMDYTAGNAEAAGAMVGSQSLHFFDVESVPAYLGVGTDTSEDFLQPCTRNNLCMGVPTPEASPGVFIDDFYFYKSGCNLTAYENCASGLQTCRDNCASTACTGVSPPLEGADCASEIAHCLRGGSPGLTRSANWPGCGDCSMCVKDPCWGKEVHLHVGAVGAEDWNRCSSDWSGLDGDVKAIGLFVAFNIPPPYPFGWGNALPRVGHVTHSSAGAASGLAALRAFNVSRYPVDVWPQFGFMRTPVTHVGEDGLKGPAPIGSPAVFPFVGPFPCMHLRPNATTGLYWNPGSSSHGSDCLPAGVWLEDAMGQPYDATKKGAFEDANVTRRQNNQKQVPENFDWVFWRHRRCTCPWPSPSALYAQWFEKQTGASRNGCIRPGAVSQVAEQVASAAANKFRGMMRAGYNAAKTAAQQAVNTAEQATVGAVENVFGDADSSFGSPGEVTATSDDRGDLGRNAEGFTGHTRGGVAQTLEVRGAGITGRETTTWGGTSGVQAVTSNTIGEAYRAGLQGSGPGSTVEVGASTLGTEAVNAGDGGLLGDLNKMKNSLPSLSITDPDGNPITIPDLTQLTDGVKTLKIPDDLHAHVSASHGDALTEGVFLESVGGEGMPVDASYWGGLDAGIGTLAGCRSDDILNGSKASTAVLAHEYCQQASCVGSKADGCTNGSRPARGRCITQKQAYEAALSACKAPCPRSCTVRNCVTLPCPPANPSCTPVVNCTSSVDAGCVTRCEARCDVAITPSAYPWNSPNPPGGQTVGFGYCSNGSEKADVEAIANGFCRQFVSGCCRKDAGGTAIEKDLGALGAFIPGTGVAGEMGCQQVVGTNP